MPPTDFHVIVTQALKLYRKGHILALAATPFADHELVASEFLAGDTITPAARGRAVQAVLTWAIEELRPRDPPPALGSVSIDRVSAPAWRFYKILRYFYIDQWTIERIAEELGFTPTSIFNLRSKAIIALADLLQSALPRADLIAARQQMTIARRYQQLDPSAQMLLRMVVLFPQPAPVRLLGEMVAAQVETSSLVPIIDGVQDNLQTLMQHSLLRYANDEAVAAASPAIREYVNRHLRADERLRWQRCAAQYYEAQLDYLAAAQHWQLAQASEVAATLLIEQHQRIINRLEGHKLDDVLTLFRPSDVTATTWARLKLLAGQVAEVRANFGAAVTAYEEALQTTDVVLKAEAHYRLARVLEYRNVDEALVHYGRGIELLERTGADNPLLVKMYIHRSWIFIQDRQDFRQAEASLQRAKALIHPQNRQDYADLYNASGELSHREGKWSHAVEDRLQAWLAAKECNDLTRIVKISYNLGRDYTELRRFDQAVAYLDQSRTLAQQSDMLDMAANCQEVMGIGYFYQGRYAEAIQAYAAAYTLFDKLKNQTALVNACFNLAEAYAINGDRAQARRYYEEGLTLAGTLTQHADDAASLLIVQRFAELKQQYPLLLVPDTLNERQQRALQYVQQFGQISNRDYRLINYVENKTAAEDLKQLVLQRLLAKVGQGAATTYQFPMTVAATAPHPAAFALPAKLNLRQHQAVDYVRQQGPISNRLYRELTGVGNKTAAADLRDLVKKRIFHQVGKGPATVYQLAASTE